MFASCLRLLAQTLGAAGDQPQLSMEQPIAKAKVLARVKFFEVCEDGRIGVSF